MNILKNTRPIFGSQQIQFHFSNAVQQPQFAEVLQLSKEKEYLKGESKYYEIINLGIEPTHRRDFGNFFIN